MFSDYITHITHVYTHHHELNPERPENSTAKNSFHDNAERVGIKSQQ